MAGVFRILGIDPGLRSTGIAVAEIDLVQRAIGRVLAVDTLRTVRGKEKAVRKTSDDLNRALAQSARLAEITKGYGISAVAIEMATRTPYNAPNFSFGVMVGIVASLNRPIIQVLPHEVKIAATGDKNATKKEMIAWALEKTRRHKIDWPTSSRPNYLALSFAGKHVALDAEHPADALATIEAALQTQQFALAISLIGQ